MNPSPLHFLSLHKRFRFREVVTVKYEWIIKRKRRMNHRNTSFQLNPVFWADESIKSLIASHLRWRGESNSGSWYFFMCSTPHPSHSCPNNGRRIFKPTQFCSLIRLQLDWRRQLFLLTGLAEGRNGAETQLHSWEMHTREIKNRWLWWCPRVVFEYNGLRVN